MACVLNRLNHMNVIGPRTYSTAMNNSLFAAKNPGEMGIIGNNDKTLLGGQFRCNTLYRPTHTRRMLVDFRNAFISRLREISNKMPKDFGIRPHRRRTRTVIQSYSSGGPPFGTVCRTTWYLPCLCQPSVSVWHISFLGLVPWHYHRSPLNYVPSPVDPGVVLLLGPL